MRSSFIDTLIQEAEKNEKIVVLTGDLGFGLFEKFQKLYPNRFFNMGVAEQNMVGVASGLALEGFIPFIYSIAPFVTLKCLEQIKLDVAYPQRSVVIVGAGGGLLYGFNGPTHYSVEDIGI